VTRGTKLGGGALMLLLVCLSGLFLFRSPSRHLQRSLSRYFAPKPTSSPRMANLPRLYLWAWERPEDLRFLANKRVGVAFLAKTVSLAPPLQASLPDSSDLRDTPFFKSIRVKVRPRLQPLHVTSGTPLMAVVRIESVRDAFPGAYSNQTTTTAKLSPQDLSTFASEIANAAQISGVTALQIDFDATLSEQTLYRDLLIEVRKRLPAEMPLSITALASWCIGDRWLEQIPSGTIDEAVPMLFRMGAGEREIMNFVASGEEFRSAACANSLGVSTDEPLSREILAGKISVGNGASARRFYVFSRSAWNQESTEIVLKEMQTWRAN
jgi:Protein of unknown function (DUF3142)